MNRRVFLASMTAGAVATGLRTEALPKVTPLAVTQKLLPLGPCLGIDVRPGTVTVARTYHDGPIQFSSHATSSFLGWIRRMCVTASPAIVLIDAMPEWSLAEKLAENFRRNGIPAFRCQWKSRHWREYFGDQPKGCFWIDDGYVAMNRELTEKRFSVRIATEDPYHDGGVSPDVLHAGYYSLVGREMIESGMVVGNPGFSMEFQ